MPEDIGTVLIRSDSWKSLWSSMWICWQPITRLAWDWGL